MNDYTRALHQRFYQEPEDTEEEQGGAGPEGHSGPRTAEASSGPGERPIPVAGAHLPGEFHRRTPLGAGHRGGVGALLLRRCSGGAGQTEAGNGGRLTHQAAQMITFSELCAVPLAISCFCGIVCC